MIVIIMTTTKNILNVRLLKLRLNGFKSRYSDVMQYTFQIQIATSNTAGTTTTMTLDMRKTWDRNKNAMKRVRIRTIATVSLGIPATTGLNQIRVG